MVLTFVWPSTRERSGGVTALYEMANALVRRGHHVHFVHGPEHRGLIDSVAELDWFPFDPRITHHITSAVDERSFPRSDVAFTPGPPGGALPCTFVQGYGMLGLEVERAAYTAPGPKACVSSWLIEIGRRFGVPADRLWLVPCGFDKALFADRSGGADRPYDIAFWHNPHPSKGTRIGWEVLHEVHRRRPDARIVVFGGEPGVDGGAGAEHPPWVTYRAGLDRERLAVEVFSAARVFLQASFVEGFGLTAVEAMSCGAALVTTDNGGSRDYAVDRDTALVVRPGDVPGLTAAVLELFYDEGLRSAVAAAGRAQVQRFDWDTSARILEGHLEAYVRDPAVFDRPLELEPEPGYDPVHAVLGSR